MARIRFAAHSARERSINRCYSILSISDFLHRIVSGCARESAEWNGLARLSSNSMRRLAAVLNINWPSDIHLNSNHTDSNTSLYCAYFSDTHTPERQSFDRLDVSSFGHRGVAPFVTSYFT